MKKEKLKHIDDTALCIQRKKVGRGYQFIDENGTKIIDKKILKRLKGLVIPPMWDQVMICKFDDGHVQAIGRDAKGRKQYIYHSLWEKIKQEEKFERIENFVSKLPEIRKICQENIELEEWNKDKVLALLVMILDEYGIRIGNQYYAQENETYGLTTLRRKHLTISKSKLIFQYKGKSNQEREVLIDDAELIKNIKKSAELPGYEIFRYQDESGGFQNIDSSDVNEFISEIIGSDFSSKDFRTWVASRLAVELYPHAIEQSSQFPRRKFSNILIKMVAESLGNTPTVCRDYYVHPAIFKSADNQEIPLKNPFKEPKKSYELSASEQLALSIIQK
ncbi:DNA topoisomerase IB [Brumimicrobium glaciale]|uniref:DNA topoisomerase n=1 Tax=Brumimicrobium glaciale TaxID=200475 RepID=A0A4Q4KNI0_9FLAO|nr:DNA topoisomerase IB [Brumimicrobium glaciale]RYM34570.1 DNA topoisomerase IB [Brumimicrobium glaciale]